jgi:ribonuclease T2
VALGSHKSKLVLAVAILGAALAWYSHRESQAPPAVRQETPDKKPAPAARASTPAPASARASAFDFYLLAMTVHSAFCAEHARQRECRARGTRPLVIHGLWPERREPRTYPHDCPAPPLDLDPLLAQQLEDFMPGMADGLHQHEWREHGGCSGLDDDLYFARTLELARALDAALAARLTTLAGRESTPAALRDTAELFSPGIGASFTLHCRKIRGSGRPVLIEIRQCVDDDGPGGAPGTLLDCAAVDRRDQGCGASFEVAARR